MQSRFPLPKFREIKTPFYYYDMELLDRTLESLSREAGKYGFVVHYAVKANANPVILEKIRNYGLGIDCVSGYEIRRAIDCGFKPSGIVFAGVGKSDWEIELGLDNDIACFNVESIPELEIINQIAASKGKTARVALRVNPNVNARTHHYITTGLKENKFGINQWDLEKVVTSLETLTNIKLEGIHFHIGSQITDMQSFRNLCNRVSEIMDWFTQRRYNLRIINVGGGLGIDYQYPDANPVPDFESYFKVFRDGIKLGEGRNCTSN